MMTKSPPTKGEKDRKVAISGVVQNGRFMGYTESGQSRANQGIPRFA